MKLGGDILSGNLPKLGGRNEGGFYISLYTYMKFYRKCFFQSVDSQKLNQFFRVFIVMTIYMLFY